MIFIKYILLIISGISAGFITAASFITFISLVGIFSKMAAKTNTNKHCVLYENCLFFGILLSTLLQFFISYSSSKIPETPLPYYSIGIFCLIMIGLFGGVYIGFLIGGLAEVLNVIPIYVRKTRLTNKLGYIIIALALGKGIFTIIQFLILNA